jgi:hypothetical protein
MVISMRTLLAVVAVALVGCADVYDTRANVGPSAAEQAPAIQKAADELNALVGYERFTVEMVDSEALVDGEVIVREDPSVMEIPSKYGGKVVGVTTFHRSGAVVRLAPGASLRGIAHELGHAAGLEHVDDPSNLMHPAILAGEWTLTEEQLDAIR